MQLRFLIPLAFSVSGFGSCWVASSDAFLGNETSSTASIQLFVDQNSNRIRDNGEPPFANSPVFAQLFRVEPTGSTLVDSKSITSDSNGIAVYSYNPFLLTTGLHQLRIAATDGSSPSEPVFRQIDLELPFRSTDVPIGNERYCVAYEGPEAIRRIEQRFGAGADLAALGAWRSLAYQIAAPELVLAASQAALQRTVGPNARVDFFAGDDPAYVLGESIPAKPATNACDSNSDCPHGQICYRNPEDFGSYCMKASPCAASTLQKAVILGATFESPRTTVPVMYCELGIYQGKKGDAPVDVRNFNNLTLSRNFSKAMVYVNTATTFERPGFPRSAVDTIKDLGRQIGRIGAHEVGHTLGLTAFQNLAGARGSAESVDATLSVNEAHHPDVLNPLINRFRVPSRPIMLSGWAPWVVQPRILVDAELERLGSCSARFSAIRVPASFSHVEAEYLLQATPNLND